MKKKISYILGMFLFSIFFSCENDMEKVVVTPNNGPENVTVNTDVPVVCTADNAKDTVLVVSWSAADFGKDISSTYTLQLDIVGNGFANAQELVAGNNVFLKHLTSDNLNSIMHKLNQPVDVATDLEVRIVAKPMVLGSSEPVLPVLYSSSKVQLNITSFAMAPLHFIGSMFGVYFVDPNVWDIANYRYVMFRDDPLSIDQYTGFIRGFDPTTYAGQFKFINDGDLNTYTMYGKADGTLSLSGGNFELEKDGYYTITASTSQMTYSIKEYDASAAPTYTEIQLTGSGVATTQTLSQAYYDPHIWIIDDVALTTGDLVFQSGSTFWAAKTFPYGKGASGGEDISVTKGGNYYIKFNDLTGHYVFYQKK
ncbi:SusE domain-containing protein [Bacteroides sp.]|uniref:SusE domain-containing protein n=1 Tax=Bacteroides sp. TaxID=29523 RepID=UPI003AB571EA